MDPILAAVVETTRDAELSGVYVSAHWTLACSRRCGLASNVMFAPHCSSRVGLDRPAGLPRTAHALARRVTSDRPQEVAVGMAAINSLIEPDPGGFHDENAGDLLKRWGRGLPMAIIGAFPFVAHLRGLADPLWVFELPERARSDTHLPGEMPRLLPRADVVGISSTTLLNGTLSGVLEHVRPDAHTILVGPTTPLSPVLFDYGLDALCGTLVEDRDRVLACMERGANFRQMEGVRKVTMLPPRATPEAGEATRP